MDRIENDWRFEKTQVEDDLDAVSFLELRGVIKIGSRRMTVLSSVLSRIASSEIWQNTFT